MRRTRSIHQNCKITVNDQNGVVYKEDDRCLRHTPVTDSQRLFISSVEHRTDDHKAGGDRTFTHPKDKSDNEKSREICACSMAAQSDRPD